MFYVVVENLLIKMLRIIYQNVFIDAKELHDFHAFVYL